MHPSRTACRMTTRCRIQVAGSEWQPCRTADMQHEQFCRGWWRESSANMPVQRTRSMPALQRLQSCTRTRCQVSFDHRPLLDYTPLGIGMAAHEVHRWLYRPDLAMAAERACYGAMILSHSDPPPLAIPSPTSLRVQSGNERRTKEIARMALDCGPVSRGAGRVSAVVGAGWISPDAQQASGMDA